MTTLLFANNASTTLAQNITGVDTTIYLAAGQGSLFPSPTAGTAFYATIYNTSNTIWEIVLVTARSGDAVTVVRAQEGTIAQTWLVGDSFGMYPTAATMNKLVQNDQLQAGKYTVVQAGGTANALTCTIESDLTSIPDGMTLVVKPVYSNTGATTLQVTIGTTVLPAVPIVKGTNLALEATDIPSAGYPVQLIYSAIFGAWVMQMPSTLISPPVPPTYTVTYLAVAGGGGGGLGGGGAGGAVPGTTTGLVGTVLTMNIGGGGAAGTNGNNSSITGVTTVTGGGAGSNYGGGGSNGGSGGGGTGGDESHPSSYPGGTGITGQGYAGGSGGSTPVGTTGQSGCGGGGGAGGAGSSGVSSAGTGAGGAGGIGLNSSITGISTYYAGGGGGGGGLTGGGIGGVGGSGGGGNGGNYGGSGLTNTGGGGGGTTFYGGAASGNGGSGVIILSVPTSRYSGVTTGSPTITTNGANTVMKFTSSGTYTV